MGYHGHDVRCALESAFASRFVSFLENSNVPRTKNQDRVLEKCSQRTGPQLPTPIRLATRTRSTKATYRDSLIHPWTPPTAAQIKTTTTTPPRHTARRTPEPRAAARVHEVRRSGGEEALHRHAADDGPHGRGCYVAARPRRACRRSGPRRAKRTRSAPAVASSPPRRRSRPHGTSL